MYFAKCSKVQNESRIINFIELKASHLFTFRVLWDNAITQLPGAFFSGLTSLEELSVELAKKKKLLKYLVSLYETAMLCIQKWQNVAQVLHINRIKFSKEYFRYCSIHQDCQGDVT